MLDNTRLILNVFQPTTKSDYAAMQSPSWDKQHDQLRDFGGYMSWIPLGNCEPSLDVPSIFRSHGHFTDWELGTAGYGSNYISVPKAPKAA